MIFGRRLLAAVGAASLLSTIILVGMVAGDAKAAEDQTTQVEVQLTESFYRALAAEGNKTYSTNKSDEYLRQIAVSSRYAVETNLKIIEQQKRIIELLEAIKAKK